LKGTPKITEKNPKSWDSYSYISLSTPHPILSVFCLYNRFGCISGLKFIHKTSVRFPRASIFLAADENASMSFLIQESGKVFSGCA